MPSFHFRPARGAVWPSPEQGGVLVLVLNYSRIGLLGYRGRAHPLGMDCTEGQTFSWAYENDKPRPLSGGAGVWCQSIKRVITVATSSPPLRRANALTLSKMPAAFAR